MGEKLHESWDDQDADRIDAPGGPSARMEDADDDAAAARATEEATRLLKPLAIGAAVFAGALSLALVVRSRRRGAKRLPAFIRVSIEPQHRSAPILPAIGGALVRFAVEQFLESRRAASALHIPVDSEEFERGSGVERPTERRPTEGSVANGH